GPWRIARMMRPARGSGQRHRRAVHRGGRGGIFGAIASPVLVDAPVRRLVPAVALRIGPDGAGQQLFDPLLEPRLRLGGHVGGAGALG
ncbi:hypothetical protein DQE80_15995, partial [Enterococcus sp. HPCN18]